MNDRELMERAALALKPHIKRDRWRRNGWICRSVELTLKRNWLGGRRKVLHIGTGPTPAAAYLDWYFHYHFKGGYDAGRIAL